MTSIVSVSLLHIIFFWRPERKRVRFVLQNTIASLFHHQNAHRLQKFAHHLLGDTAMSHILCLYHPLNNSPRAPFFTLKRWMLFFLFCFPFCLASCPPNGWFICCVCKYYMGDTAELENKNKSSLGAHDLINWCKVASARENQQQQKQGQYASSIVSAQ